MIDFLLPVQQTCSWAFPNQSRLMTSVLGLTRWVSSFPFFSLRKKHKELPRIITTSTTKSNTFRSSACASFGYGIVIHFLITQSKVGSGQIRLHEFSIPCMKHLIPSCLLVGPPSVLQMMVWLPKASTKSLYLQLQLHGRRGIFSPV
jgi:hypothetical protein